MFLFAGKRQFSFSDLKFLQPEVLKDWIICGKSTYMIIDVREDDYLIGKIKSSLNIPYYTLDQTILNRIYQKLIDENITNIIFHCSYSQQRGPSTALKFLRSLDDNGLLKLDRADLNVWVLKGGFNKFYKKYGSNPTLVTDIKKN